ncbi:complement factor H-like [Arvicola amphibius]|uniref:complement factor H-like n=1 Tax=Arvicola amphibius TaxID=1047088 RepID=UPI0018E3503B|nr:complement factor H-like [Arvicola amphibius]
MKIVYKVDESFQYQCHQGFVYRERGDAICTASGWSPQPFCEVKPCNFPQIKNGDVYFEMDHIPFPVATPMSFEYYCDRGFLPPSGKNWDSIHCTAQGWEPAVPCLRLCGIYDIENGEVLQEKGEYIQDQSVRVQCYPGYSLPNGQDTVTCTENGWSPQPVCAPVNCRGPPPEQNTEILLGSWSDQLYPEETWAIYKCQPGYQTFGTIVKVCRRGEWVALNPSRICGKSHVGILETHPLGPLGWQLEPGLSLVQRLFIPAMKGIDC